MMEAAMDLARFETLADAYGADLRRWPAAERDAGRALLDAEPAARALLAAADDLDALLAASPQPAVSAALRTAIATGAPKPRSGGWLFKGAGFWLSGAGLAAAGVAGVLVGATVFNDMVHDAQADAVLAEVLPDASVDVLPLSLSTQGGVA